MAHAEAAAEVDDARRPAELGAQRVRRTPRASRPSSARRRGGAAASRRGRGGPRSRRAAGSPRARRRASVRTSSRDARSSPPRACRPRSRASTRTSVRRTPAAFARSASSSESTTTSALAGRRTREQLVLLVVAVDDEPVAADAGAAGELELAEGRDVGAEPFLAEQPEHRDRREGLRAVDDQGIGRGGAVRPRLCAQTSPRRRRRAACRTLRASSVAATPPRTSSPLGEGGAVGEKLGERGVDRLAASRLHGYTGRPVSLLLI